MKRKTSLILMPDESLSEFYLFCICIYRVFKRDNYLKEKAIFGVYKKILKNKIEKYYVLGVRIARVTPTDFSILGCKWKFKEGSYEFSFCGIPIIKKDVKAGPNNRNAPAKSDNPRSNCKDVIHSIQGIKLEISNQLSKLEERQYLAMWFPSKVAALHQKVFPQFKDIHAGEDIVIVGCGPTLHYYTPIPNAKHISLNRAFRCSRIKFDYAFIWDMLGLMRGCDNVIEDFGNYDCIKFCGKFLCEHSGYPSKIKSNKGVLYRCYSSARWRTGLPTLDTVIHEDISIYPLADFMSISFAALHFALWTQPRRIYLVGLDTVKNGSFDGRQNPYHFKEMFQGYTLFQKFISLHYFETEIISVNPIGLRGMFHDVYTESYLEQNRNIHNPSILNI